VSVMITNRTICLSEWSRIESSQLNMLSWVKLPDILSEVEYDETIGGCGFDSERVCSFVELKG
jgi:hypothetical protein